MKRRICLLAGQFDVTLSVSNGLAAWSRQHQSWRIEVLSHPDARNITWLARAGYAGLVAVDAPLEMQKQLALTRRPCVCVQSAAGPLPSILVDDLAIGRLGAQHLYDSGYRNMVFYGIDASWSRQRHDAFAATLASRSLDCRTNQSQDRWPDWNSSQDERQVKGFIKSLPRPVAIMACSDLLARVLADACGELHLNVPADVAILGVDNSSSLCESDQVTLSSIDPDLERLGHEAGRLLSAILSRSPVRQPIYIPPHGVIQRRSTNAAAFDDVDVARAMRFIHENACDGISVDDISRHLSVSRRQLERRFAKCVGELPGAQLRKARLTRARELLADTTLSLTEVALRCGYDHLSSFSAAFSDYVGVPPSQFRRDVS
ncbi:MAG TPA: substrate-binding domain-containing protein [Tepidisphaeraceae bacterium]|nr:substrate-binding domain-containing protein [Tepidisphaeraceae bacterium]